MNERWDYVISLLRYEYERSNYLHGPFPTNLFTGLAFVVEELGAVAQAMVEYDNTKGLKAKEQLETEAIHLLNTAFKLAESVFSKDEPE